MSFGFSPSDIVALVNITSKAYNGWRSACGEYSEITGSLDSLLIVLERIRTEALKPGSVLLRTSKDKQDLKDILYSTEPTVRDLHAVVLRHRSLGSSRQKNWDKLRFGVKNLEPLRTKLTQHVATIIAYLDTVGLGALGRIERDLNAIPERMQKTIDSLVEEIRAGRREGTVMTAYSDDDTEIWKQFRRELIGDGMKSDVVYKYKPLIRKYLQELAERGDLEELPPEELQTNGLSSNTASPNHNFSGVSFNGFQHEATSNSTNTFQPWESKGNQNSQQARSSIVTRIDDFPDRTNIFKAWQYMQKDSRGLPLPQFPARPNSKFPTEDQVRAGMTSLPPVYPGFANGPSKQKSGGIFGRDPEPVRRRTHFGPNALGPDEKPAESSAYSPERHYFPPPPIDAQSPRRPNDQVPFVEGNRNRTPYSSSAKERTDLTQAGTKISPSPQPGADPVTFAFPPYFPPPPTGETVDLLHGPSPTQGTPYLPKYNPADWVDFSNEKIQTSSGSSGPVSNGEAVDNWPQSSTSVFQATESQREDDLDRMVGLGSRYLSKNTNSPATFPLKSQSNIFDMPNDSTSSKHMSSRSRSEDNIKTGFASEQWEMEGEDEELESRLIQDFHERFPEAGSLDRFAFSSHKPSRAPPELPPIVPMGVQQQGKGERAWRARGS